jgi:hypothetical protein
VVERSVQLVDGRRPERVAHLGSVECDPHDTGIDRSVIRDVDEVLESVDRAPEIGVEQL